MHEFLKVTCVVAIMIGAVTAAFVWSDKPSNGVWTMRIISTAMALAGLVGFIVLHFRRDRVPDFLGKSGRGYFDRGGLCFVIEPIIQDGCCQIRVLFQNRYERRCRAEIALRPAEVFGFFASEDILKIKVDVDCPAAGFGVATLPLPIPLKLQGTRQTFQVGATVEYPDGRGRTLRYGSNDITVRSNADFSNPFHGKLAIAAALGGSILIGRPPLIAFVLPNNVAEHLPSAGASCQVLWQLGDSPDHVDALPAI